ncbi:diacylglycerol kinase family protein [Arthrobacter castelli]|uniref:diacylglycerol kinase family protein n=1 Tax=Arthrobacter castelli TaxID=271431 RepID=UPI00040435A1
MDTWIPALIIGVIIIIGLASWYGVRKLHDPDPEPRSPINASSSGRGEQRVAVVINPVKTNADRARKIIKAECKLAGWPEPVFLETTVDDPGAAMTAEALKMGADVVLACGGDGTVRVVAEGLTGTDVNLGLVPLGTGNLLARNLEMNISDLDGSIAAALFGDERTIDTGLIELENADTGEVTKHTFLVMAGIGFDAKMISGTRDDLKKNMGWLAYGESGVRHLPGRRTKVGIALDDEPEQNRRVRSVLFGNCGLLPGGIDFIPSAVIDDGIMDVVVMSPRSALGWLAMAGKVLFKPRRPSPSITFYRAKEITLHCTEPMETQLDGDPSGPVKSLSVQVARCALTVRVHRKDADGRQQEQLHSVVEGQSVEGQSVEGQSVEGQSVEDPTRENPALKNPATEDRAIEDRTPGG